MKMLELFALGDISPKFTRYILNVDFRVADDYYIHSLKKIFCVDNLRSQNRQSGILVVENCVKGHKPQMYVITL